jgi:hypothetical protein
LSDCERLADLDVRIDGANESVAGATLLSGTDPHPAVPLARTSPAKRQLAAIAVAANEDRTVKHAAAGPVR